MTRTRLDKGALREAALARRAALSQDERAAGSLRATDRLVPLLRHGEAVALFWPIRGEIDPLGLLGPVRGRDGTVLLPAVVDGNIRFRCFEGDQPLQRGPLGTSHPPPTAPERDPALVIAPLSAFDRDGGRIGYGGGYYDRALARLRAAGRAVRFIGIAFACQEVETVPMEAHDIRLDAVATEAEFKVFAADRL